MFAMVKAASVDAAAELDDFGRYRDDGAEYRDHDDDERDSSRHHRYDALIDAIGIKSAWDVKQFTFEKRELI